jgi:hypothetical protein
MAVDVTLAVLADYANVSQEGKLNILGVFQEVNPVAFPAGVPQMFVLGNLFIWECCIKLRNLGWAAGST